MNKRLLRYRWRLGAFALVVGAGVGLWRAPSGEASSNTARFLEQAYDLTVTDDSVHLADESAWPLALGHRTVVFLASRPREPRDLYRADIRISPDGNPIATRWLANLTATTAGDEDTLAESGPRVATRTRVSDRYTAVTLVDLTGENQEVSEGRSLFWRFMWAVRNTIEFGTRRGIERHAYRLLDPAEEVALELDESGLALRFDGNSAQTDENWALQSGDELIDHTPPTREEPSLIPFTVNAVRAISWVGPRPIEWMEWISFNVHDLGLRGLQDLGMSSTENGQELTQEMSTADDPPRPADINLVDLPGVDFPPDNLRPIRDDPLEGEGEWRPVADPRFVRLNPGAPPCFATTFLRPDTAREYARTFIVVWDPRQVELYPVAGTIEPMSATGVRGSGLVPREEVDRMVAGFNGGFQATHGEYGMMMEGTLFVPPKGYGATIASLADGRTGLGTWNEEVDVIPPAIVAFRQNMTPLVHDHRVNPFLREWWGAAPQGTADPTYTQRSGVCLTDEGFVAYFWGPSLSPESLGAAMLAARCNHGTHLDMNAILTGFEFYHVAPTGELPELERDLDEPFEGEGDVPFRDDLVFRARRLARGMKHMNFPRYIRRDTRDFFWLKLRHVLPGAPLEPAIEPALEGEGEWRVKGLPVGGFPPAFARTFIRPDAEQPEGRVELVRIDPRAIRGALGRPGDWPRQGPAKQATKAGALAAIVTGTGIHLAQGKAPAGERTIALVGSELVRPAVLAASEVGKQARSTMVALGGPPLSGATKATLALAPDEDGFLVAALEPTGNAKLLEAALRLAGADPEQAVALGGDDDADLVFFAGQGKTRRAATLSGRPAPDFGSTDALLLLDAHVPQGVRIFPDVPAVLPRRWKRFHRKREVYLRSPDGQYRHVTGQELPRHTDMQLDRSKRKRH